MELEVISATGLPSSGGVLSLKLGNVRKQGPLPCREAFRVPVWPCPTQIDVMRNIGRSPTGISLTNLDANGCCKVPLKTRDGRPMSMTVRVTNSKAESDRSMTKDEEAQLIADEKENCYDFLEGCGLKDFLQEAFEHLMNDRPADPYTYLYERFREAAAAEAVLAASPPRPEEATPVLKLPPATAKRNISFAGDFTTEGCAKASLVRRGDREENARKALRPRAAKALVAGSRDGRLLDALHEAQRGASQPAPQPATATKLVAAEEVEPAAKSAGPPLAAQVHKPQIGATADVINDVAKAPQEVMVDPRARQRELVKKARVTLSGACRQGKLLAELEKVAGPPSTDTGGCDANAKEMRPVSPTRTVDAAGRAQVLRKRAKDSLAAGQKNGRLQKALSVNSPGASPKAAAADANTPPQVEKPMDAVDEEMPQAKHSAPGGSSANAKDMQPVSSEGKVDAAGRAQVLRKRAKDSFAAGQKTGRLQEALSVAISPGATPKAEKPTDAIDDGVSHAKQSAPVSAPAAGDTAAAPEAADSDSEKEFAFESGCLVVRSKSQPTSPCSPTRRTGREAVHRTSVYDEPDSDDDVAPVQHLPCINVTAAGGKPAQVAVAAPPVAVSPADKPQEAAEESHAKSSQGAALIDELQKVNSARQGAAGLRNRARATLLRGSRGGLLAIAISEALGGLPTPEPSSSSTAPVPVPMGEKPAAAAQPAIEAAAKASGPLDAPAAAADTRPAPTQLRLRARKMLTDASKDGRLNRVIDEVPAGPIILAPQYGDDDGDGPAKSASYMAESAARSKALCERAKAMLTKADPSGLKKALNLIKDTDCWTEPVIKKLDAAAADALLMQSTSVGGAAEQQGQEAKALFSGFSSMASGAWNAISGGDDKDEKDKEKKEVEEKRAREEHEAQQKEEEAEKARQRQREAEEKTRKEAEEKKAAEAERTRKEQEEQAKKKQGSSYGLFGSIAAAADNVWDSVTGQDSPRDKAAEDEKERQKEAEEKRKAELKAEQEKKQAEAEAARKQAEEVRKQAEEQAKEQMRKEQEAAEKKNNEKKTSGFFGGIASMADNAWDSLTGQDTPREKAEEEKRQKEQEEAKRKAMLEEQARKKAEDEKAKKQREEEEKKKAQEQPSSGFFGGLATMAGNAWDTLTMAEAEADLARQEAVKAAVAAEAAEKKRLAEEAEEEKTRKQREEEEKKKAQQQPSSGFFGGLATMAGNAWDTLTMAEAEADLARQEAVKAAVAAEAAGKKPLAEEAMPPQQPQQQPEGFQAEDPALSAEEIRRRQEEELLQQQLAWQHSQQAAQAQWLQQAGMFQMQDAAVLAEMERQRLSSGDRIQEPSYPMQGLEMQHMDDMRHKIAIMQWEEQMQKQFRIMELERQLQELQQLQYLQELHQQQSQQLQQHQQLHPHGQQNVSYEAATVASDLINGAVFAGQFGQTGQSWNAVNEVSTQPWSQLLPMAPGRPTDGTTVVSEFLGGGEPDSLSASPRLSNFQPGGADQSAEADCFDFMPASNSHPAFQSSAAPQADLDCSDFMLPGYDSGVPALQNTLPPAGYADDCNDFMLGDAAGAGGNWPHASLHSAPPPASGDIVSSCDDFMPDIAECGGPGSKTRAAPSVGSTRAASDDDTCSQFMPPMASTSRDVAADSVQGGADTLSYAQPESGCSPDAALSDFMPFPGGHASAVPSAAASLSAGVMPAARELGEFVPFAQHAAAPHVHEVGPHAAVLLGESQYPSSVGGTPPCTNAALSAFVPEAAIGSPVGFRDMPGDVLHGGHGDVAQFHAYPAGHQAGPLDDLADFMPMAVGTRDLKLEPIAEASDLAMFQPDRSSMHDMILESPHFADDLPRPSARDLPLWQLAQSAGSHSPRLSEFVPGLH
eukprot:TRINITY_DN1288_c0_g1_i4.p1 TRINITY_DN1288_c0_g1~~TRINITY_DN1288_c0_g1_i4.p1  ORF type:complete len:1872 (-),score=546.55 TRINITY_DN1288_c0_g1_i4:103-5718(-)